MKKNREILIAVTFRDFVGDENEIIQKEFLNSLLNQTYKNFKLVVTNFREKYVRKTLNNIGIPFELHQATDLKHYYSFTDTIVNCFSHIRKGENILLWTNADNIFEDNFFEVIINNFDSGCGGTSYPGISHPSYTALKENKTYEWYFGKSGRSFFSYDPNVYIPDVIYIDADKFIDKSVQNTLKRYRIAGMYPGVAQTLMLANYANSLNNIYFLSKIHTIVNSDETYKNRKIIRVNNDHEDNMKLIESFCIERGFNKSEYYNSIFYHKKLVQHKKYIIVGNPIQKIMYKLYFVYYTLFPRKKWLIFRLFRYFVGRLLRKLHLKK